MERYSLRTRNPSQKRLSNETKSPKSAKKSKVSDVVAEEKVRLDYLVVEKCVAHMHQRFHDDFLHETVSSQFATALKSVHGKTSIFMKIDYFLLDIELQNVVRKRCPETMVHKNAIPPKILIKLQAGDHKNFRSVLSKLFSRFKRIKRLVLFDLDKSAHRTLTNAIRDSQNVRFRRLEIKTDICSTAVSFDEDHQPSSFQDTSRLLQCVSPQVKELQIEGDFSIGFAASKRFWKAISNCSALRRLNIIDVDSFDNDYSKEHLLESLKLLKIDRLTTNTGLGLFFDSDETMLSALQENANLQYLFSNAGPTFFSSPLLQPILLRLRHLSIDTVIDGLIAESDRLKSEILSILQALPDNGTLCVRLMMIFEEDEAEKMLTIFKLFLELSNSTKKPIEIVFRHMFPDFMRYPTADDLADLIIEQLIPTEEYRNLSYVEYPDSYILKINNAKIKMSVVAV